MAAREKRNFTVACGLLSQLVKEKGNVVNLNLDKNEVYRRPTATMNLLPGADVLSEQNETEPESFKGTGNTEMELFPQSVGFYNGKSVITEAREQEKSELTIFYGGKVLVFDNFPAEKAKDLMNYAIKGNPTSCNSTYISASSSSTPPTPSTEQPKVSSTTANPIASAQIHAQRQPILSDLPIMRKASLQRFLAKRKDRISAKAPYQLSNKTPMISSIKTEDTDSWLGLGTKVTNV